MISNENAAPPVAADVDWVARAQELAPLIERSAPRIDAERELPAELTAALHASGMYRLLIPRSCGGAEVDLLTYAKVIETLAAADASTAWCVGQVTGSSMSAAYLGLETAREICGAPDFVLAWGPPAPGGTNRADAVPGGLRVTGTWQFASGSRQATWLGAQVGVYEADGAPRLNAAGKPAILTVLFPRSSATITDIWQVTGLRGTGSDRYAIADLFVPEDRAFTRERLGWREPGPLYRMSMTFIHAVAFAAVALGIARATLDAFVALAGHKRPTRGSSGQPLRENNAIQAHIGLAEARLRGARAYLHASSADAWAEASAMTDGQISLERRIDMRLASTFAIGQAEKVVDIAYRLAGATAIFEGQPFQQRFRDMHAVTQQIQGHLSNYETVGQHRLGIPLDLLL